jgi:outer membrane protein assembly factor BamB
MIRTVLLIALCLNGPAVADDWPHWMGPYHDGSWREDGIVEQFHQKTAKIAWRVPIGAGYGGPAVAEDRIVVMDRVDDNHKGNAVENNLRQAGQLLGRERILCLSVADGSILWSHDYDCPYEIAYPTGPRYTPTIEGDRVYTLGAMGQLTCLRLNDGSVAWQKNLTTEFSTKPPIWGYASHPLVVGDQLLLPVGGEGSAVVAFDKNTGQERWRSLSTRDIAYAPLVMYQPKPTDARQLIFWYAEGVDALDPETGKSFWHIKFPEDPRPSETSIATPRIYGDKLLITEYYTGALCLQVHSAPPGVTELWRSTTRDPKLHSSMNSLMMTPVIKDGYAYGIANDPRGRGIFRCIRVDTGEEVWSKADWMTKEPETFATGFLVAQGDRYFLFADNGELLIVRLSPAGFEEIDRAKILEPTGAARGRTVVWSHPAFAQGHMFVRNDKEFVCVDLRRG